MKNEADLLLSYAEREALRSRERLLATLAEIRHRIDPRVIVAETVENIVGRANHMASTTTTAVRARPALSIAGLAAFMGAVGLRLWLTRSKQE